ncbi:Aste57867_17758 [Aphanomyces stellatus]|uniref:Aste57867_17758 protein n=1 Tax=Aphanomyces stellatus TaxID=120398 RepID=A0A485L8D7_9STRA|nr:hypothetical protein As57867_017697 [Aphanomyces stellatus]VFT94504.1 Aste57867_17758 [Aphanomyces stellatus]
MASTSNTMRNRFQNDDKKGTTEIRNVSLGPKVYEGERFGKMSERLKRRNVEIQTVDRNPRVYGFFVGFLIIVFVLIWVKLSGITRIRG